MFGYIRPYKPMLRMCEYEGYKSIYCGICKALGRNFGTVPRLALSYDAVLLALLEMSVKRIELKAEMQRCIIHPVKKRNVAVSEGLDYSAYVSVLLTYHKLKDDLRDSSFTKRAAAETALTAVSGAYKKAVRVYPHLASVFDYWMKRQNELEDQRSESLDIACEPTARIMKAIAEGLAPDDKSMARKLGRFGYFLGRYLYIIDAVDDLKADCESGNYNPIAIKYGLKGKISDIEFNKAAENTAFSIRLTLGVMARNYVKLGELYYKPIIDNIIYLGMTDILKKVVKGEYRKNTKERKDKI